MTPFDTIEVRAWASPIWYASLPEPGALPVLAGGVAAIALLARRRAKTRWRA